MQPIKLEAQVTLLSEQESGIAGNIKSGSRVDLSVGGHHTACDIESVAGDAWMVRGKTYEVMLSLPFGEFYREQIRPGMQIVLTVAEKPVAHGTAGKIL